MEKDSLRLNDRYKVGHLVNNVKEKSSVKIIDWHIVIVRGKHLFHWPTIKGIAPMIQNPSMFRMQNQEIWSI
jgi:hypothetical protein